MDNKNDKHHWSWKRFKAFFSAFIKGKNYFLCGFPYQLSIEENLLMREQVLDEMQEEDFDINSWQIEMEAMFFGESEKAYFSYEDLNRSRTIKKPFLPMTDEEYIKYKGDKNRYKFFKKKKPGEIRVMGVDVAIMGGAENDATSFMFVRCLPHGNEYIKTIEYAETMEGQHSSIQALRLKQLFYDFDCDFCAMDTGGNGISIYEEVTKITIDNARGVEYPAWSAMNDDKMRDRAFDKNAVPLIYSIKITGIGGAESNHEMATYTKTQFQKNKVQLLCSEIEGKEYLLENQKELKFTDEEIKRMIAAYFQITRLVHEMINLETEAREGYIKLKTVGMNRKDRYSSLAYPFFYIKGLERELRLKDTEEDGLTLLSKYSFL